MAKCTSCPEYKQNDATVKCSECGAELCLLHIFECRKCNKPMCLSCWREAGRDLCRACSAPAVVVAPNG